MEEIVFERNKIFRYIDKIGEGGTGSTILVEEEETDMLFAIKKYSPIPSNDTEDNYRRFVDEMKILFKLSHPNIVRIYNYFLYPEFMTGYLQMEYVDGAPIDKWLLNQNHNSLERVFLDVLSAFEYLESKNILHRDIRNSNIMIDNDGKVNVIDFGFGKMLENMENEENSIILNWPVTNDPEEVEKYKEYNHQTEIYYLGNLINNLLGENKEEFKYYNIIKKMCEIKIENRYGSFEEIQLQISGELFNKENFTENEKTIYIKIADILIEKINHLNSELNVIEDRKIVLMNLKETIRKSTLEDVLQDNQLVINCFLNNGYNYSKRRDIQVDQIKDFYGMFKDLSPFKQDVVLDNIHTRLKTIEVIQDIVEMDDLPF